MSTIVIPSVAPSPTSTRRGEPAWELAHLFPPQGEWTEEEYLDLKTNRLIELSDGCLEVLPVPTALHQFIVRLLFRLLDAFVVSRGLGEVLFAPLPVRLWAGKYREPDVIYVRPERIRSLREQLDGADLVMEVVSEGEENRERDLETKRREYARAGIAEYWIVDARERCITVLALDDRTYRVHGQFGPGTQADSALLPGFTVAVDDVFAPAEGSAS